MPPESRTTWAGPQAVGTRAPSERSEASSRTSIGALIERALRDSPLKRLLGRRGLDDAPFVLSQRRLFILPTRTGLLYAGLLVGLLIGSANYGISLGYLFTFLLGGLGTVAMFHTQRNLSGLRLMPRPGQSVCAGEAAYFPLTLENPTGLPRFALELRGADDPVFRDVPARDTAMADILAQPMTRGIHPLGRVTLASTWPLGLFRCWTVFEFDWSILVYPRLAETHVPLPPAHGAGRASLTEAPGDDSFAGLRGYRAGDSPRHIAWKAVARGMTLQTKQFTGQPAGTLWLDWHAAPEHGTEAKLSRLARWSMEAESGAGDWGLRLPTLAIGPGRGEAHLRNCLEALARHED